MQFLELGASADIEMTKEPPNVPRNQIKVIFDGRLTPALVDTGSSICVLSLAIRRRLGKVLLPSQGPLVRFAFNAISTPLASTTARLIINGACYPSELRELAESSHRVILGCDFLVENEAVIGYIRNEILLSDEARHGMVVLRIFPKLYVASDTTVMSQSTLYVCLVGNSVSPSEILLEPRKDTSSKKGLMTPYCLCLVRQDRVFLPITNTLMEAVVVLPSFCCSHS